MFIRLMSNQRYNLLLGYPITSVQLSRQIHLHYDLHQGQVIHTRLLLLV